MHPPHLGRNLLLLGSLACATSGLFASPVINEIMFRPGTSYPENTALEFIEIHNPDSAAIDLSSWQITTGADFTFPSGTSIPAGGYLIVSPKPSALQEATGLSGVLGPWKSGAKLSNNGEDITLCNAEGTVIDKITYADEGDWATRTRDGLGGWSWVSNADDAGCSLERINPNLACDNGQNWAASTAAGGTPGALNSRKASNVAPIISELSHYPAVPKSTDTVTISCRLQDESASSALSATLWWRNATSTSPGSYNSVAMTHEGGGRFTAALSALADKQIVEFYVEANDGSLSRTWPAPTSEGQNANCCYQVDNEDVSGSTANYYRLVLTASENAAFNTYTSSSGGPGASIGDRMFNVTLVATQGDEATIRYRSSMRVRGNSSRSYTIKPLRISLPTDSRWGGISDFNLNPRGAPVAYLAQRLQQAAGLPSSDAIAVELRRQGIEYAVSSGSSADHGRILRVEEINGDFVDNHWPEAVEGQIYRKTSVSSWAYTSSTAASDPETTWSGWSKQSGSGANDWSDVMNFTKVWQDTAASHFTGATSGNVASGTWNKVAFTDTEVATLATIADLDELARWLAVMTILQNNEPNLSTGEDDDYAAAFINNGTNTRMLVVPHDMDTVLGQGEQTYAATAVGLYDATEVDTVQRAGVGSVTLMKPLLPLLGNSSTPGNAAFRAKYLNEIRELFGTVFDADTSTNSYPPFHQFVDRHLDWCPASYRSSVKTFMTQRQSYLLGLIGAAKITPDTATATATSAAAQTPTLRINEILASNSAAYAHNGSYADIIELHNAGDSAADIGGMSLSDDADNPTAFSFPSGTSIPAGGYLLVYADDDTTADGYHTGFGLSADGETLTLYSSAGDVIDTLAFGWQVTDLSLSRSPSSPETWVLSQPSLGSANTAAITLGSPAALCINEWCGNRQFRISEDFVELYNSDSAPVPLGGMILTDDVTNYPSRYTIAPLSFLDAGAFKAVDGDALGFGLNGTFDFISLLGSNGTMVDQVDMIAQAADHSTGRSPDGGTTWAVFSIPTPGQTNATTLPSAYQTLLDSLRISELMYAADKGSDYDYIEVSNIGSTTLDLSGVRLTNGVEYSFASGTSLDAGDSLVVCKKRKTFLARYPLASSHLADGTYSGNLSNDGEKVTLTLPPPWDLNIQSFEYAIDWYNTTLGGGASLCARNLATESPSRADLPLFWKPSLNLLGSPGSLISPTLSYTLPSTTTCASSLSLSPATTGIPVQFTATGLPSGLSLDSASGAITGKPSDAGSYTVNLSGLNGEGANSTSLLINVSPSIDMSGSNSGTISAGSDTSLLAGVDSGTTAVSLQWQKLVDGVWTNIEGETSATLRFASLQGYQSGSYRLVATAAGLSSNGETIVVEATLPTNSDARFSNLSSRALCLTGTNNVVLGFVVSGTGNRRLLVRSVGPGLEDYGVGGFMSAPSLTLLRKGSGESAYSALGSNAGWESSGLTTELSAAFAQTYAFALKSGSADAAMLSSQDEALYTAQTDGADGGTGVVLTEIYDATEGENPSRLINLSTRAWVGTGDGILVAGFAITGTEAQTVLLRAVGPGLEAHGVDGILSDPNITLYRISGDGSAEAILENDDWSMAANKTDLVQATTATGAFALVEGSKDGAMLVTLSPGVYTAEIRGANEGTGVALVELYEVR